MSKDSLANADDAAFTRYAEPGFRWTRVTPRQAPDLRHDAWVYYLQANGKVKYVLGSYVPWYLGARPHPPAARPIAYVVTDEQLTPEQLDRFLK